jgi:DNA polymerase V
MNDKEILPPLEEPVGFSTPIYDAMEAGLNLHQLLVTNPPATFFMRASMDFAESGIFEGDVLIVDRSLTPKNGSVVIAIAEGEFILKKMGIREKSLDFQLWGLVTYVIHRTR